MELTYIDEPYAQYNLIIIAVSVKNAKYSYGSYISNSFLFKLANMYKLRSRLYSRTFYTEHTFVKEA